MAMSKKLINITVSHSPGKVGISRFYESSPAEHELLPLSVAQQLRDKLIKACDIAARERPEGDDVAVSDHVALKLN